MSGRNKKDDAGCVELEKQQESCQLNSAGQYVCDTTKEKWKYCPGKEPVLVSTIKVTNEVREKPAFVVHQQQRPINLSDLFQGFGIPHFLVLEELPELNPQSPITSTPKGGSHGSELPEPEHWRAK